MLLADNRVNLHFSLQRGQRQVPHKNQLFLAGFLQGVEGDEDAPVRVKLRFSLMIGNLYKYDLEWIFEAS